MNLSTNIFGSWNMTESYSPIVTCAEYCATQNYINHNNELIEAFSMLFFAIGLSFAVFLLLQYGEIDENRIKIMYVLNIGIMLFISGFLFFWRFFYA